MKAKVLLATTFIMAIAAWGACRTIGGAVPASPMPSDQTSVSTPGTTAKEVPRYELDLSACPEDIPLEQEVPCEIRLVNPNREWVMAGNRIQVTIPNSIAARRTQPEGLLTGNLIDVSFDDMPPSDQRTIIVWYTARGRRESLKIKVDTSYRDFGEYTRELFTRGSGLSVTLVDEYEPATVNTELDLVINLRYQRPPDLPSATPRPLQKLIPMAVDLYLELPESLEYTGTSLGAAVLRAEGRRLILEQIGLVENEDREIRVRVRPIQEAEAVTVLAVRRAGFDRTVKIELGTKIVR